MITALRLCFLLSLVVLPFYGQTFMVVPSGGYSPGWAQSQAAPIAATRVFKVGVQIGHYKSNELPPQLARLADNTGTYGGGRSEVDLNFDIANRVARLLRASGIQVDLLPATVPSGYSADAFVAIHADGSSSSAARGFKISTRWSSVVALQDVRLVEMLTDAYRTATGLPEDSNVTRNMRGYYAYSPRRPNYRVSNFTPGAIVEMGFMTNATDRRLMFNSPEVVAGGIARGIVGFLKEAYPQGSGRIPYGAGIVDNNIDVRANPTPFPTPRPNAPRTTSRGNWQVVLMGKPTVNVYSAPGDGTVIGKLARDQFYHSLIRNGDYYAVTLPDGKQGWVHRNAVVVQM
jgi:N-acetylmuramoyl-L-alanine amidase